MLSISGSSNSASNVYQTMLQALSTSRASTSQSTSSSEESATTTTSRASGASSEVAPLFSELRDQIEAAINEVMQNYNGGETEDPTEMFSQIHSAVDEVLKENGIEPSRRPDGFAGPPPGAGGGFPGMGGPSEASDSQSIDELLAQTGIDMDELRQNLLSALRNSEDGSVDWAEIFKDVPSGSSVDVMA